MQGLLQMKQGSNRRNYWAAGLIAIATASAAQAQVTPQPGETGLPDNVEAKGNDGDIVVTGERYVNRAAIQAKRANPRIADVVSASEVGSLPDFGFGEAMRRIPGISLVQNNQRGEDQFVGIRGLNSAYTLVVRDGIALPSTEVGRRSVSLDVLPSTIASQITVTKSLTPDMDGNAIGGQINYRTPSAFDHDRLFGSIRVDYGDYQNGRRYSNRTPSGKIDALLTTRFGNEDQFGLVVGGSYFRRDSSSTDPTAASYGYYDAAGARLALNSPSIASANAGPLRRDYYVYDNLRDRLGLFGKLEFNNHNGIAATISAAQFTHKNDEDRNDNVLAASGNLTNVTATSGTAQSGTGTVQYDRYFQRRQIRYVTGTLDLQPTERDEINFRASYGVGRFSSANVESIYTGGSASSLFGYDYSYNQSDFPILAPRNAAATDPSRYRQTLYGYGLNRNIEKATTVGLDYGHNMSAQDQGLGFKAGTQFRLLDRNYDHTESYYQPVSTALAPLLSTQIRGNSFSPFIDPAYTMMLVDQNAAEAYFQANKGNYALLAATADNNISGNYGVKENVYSGYFMTTWRGDRLRMTAGLRYELTDFKSSSYTRSAYTTPAQYALAQRSSSYGNLLPSFNASYDVTGNVKLRAAYARAIGRPDYDDLATPATITRTPMGLSVARGNADLKARLADNYDLSFEWYFASDSIFSAALFRKDIANEIFRSVSEDTLDIGGVPTLVTVSQARNLDKARVEGLELGLVVSSLGSLSSPLRGLGFSTNVTLLKTNPTSILMNNGTYRQLNSLLEQADTVFNASLFYSIGRFSAKAAYNYTGRQLAVVGTDFAANDRYLGAANIVDLQASYRVRKNLTFMVTAKNVGNDRPTRYFGPGGAVTRDVIDNGRSFFAGASYKF